MDQKIKELLTRLSFFAEDGMADKPIVEIAKQADALLLEVARKPNTQQPAAYMVVQPRCKAGKTFLSEAAAYAELLASPAGSELVNLYTAQPVPRDVLMAALADCREECAKHYLGNDDDSEINLAAIADRYASQVQPEPVNQQMLAALKMVLDDPDALDGRPRTYKCVMEAIAAAEAAQPVVYPIERVLTDADHLAHCVDALLLALNECHGAEARVEAAETAANVLELERREEAVSECWRAAHTATYEYRKRAQRFRDSAATKHPAIAQPVAVPDGWQLVPVEPTHAMKKAGVEIEIGDEERIVVTTFDEVRDIYRAMLAAHEGGRRG